MKTLLLALALAACSSDTGSTPSPDAPAGPTADAPIVTQGTVTLTGALSGSGPVSVTGLKNDTDATSIVTMAGLTPLPTNVTSFAMSMQINGTPAANVDTTGTQQSGIILKTGDGKTYAAGAGQGATGTLHFSSVDVFDHANGVTVYTLHGTYTGASLVNTTGGSDTVGFSATF